MAENNFLFSIQQKKHFLRKVTLPAGLGWAKTL
jgi:hypothetical protein